METPLQRFQQSKTDVSWLADVVDNSIFERAKDAALLELQRKTVTPEQSDAMRGFYKIEGAQLVFDILERLSKKEMPVVPQPRNRNLKHNV